MPLVIDSPQNPRVKQWCLLQTPRGRRDEGLVWAEGEHLVQEAFRSRWQVQTVIRSTDYPSSIRVDEQLVTPRVFEKVSETTSPQGIAAVVQLPSWTVPSDARLVLVLDGVQDPGNVGTLLRTALAAGFGGAYLTPDCADPFGGKALRASQGAAFHLPIERLEAREVIVRQQAENRRLVGTGSSGAIDCRGAATGERMALVLGREGCGLREPLVHACDRLVRIPMAGGVESLGVAVAGGILMFLLAFGGGHDVGLHRAADPE
jgi:TrmH family RNA methyltransferase